MYYARRGDSFNISAEGEGNAVLLKSAVPHAMAEHEYEMMINIMQKLNPLGNKPRKPEALCSGQTLLCRSLL